MRSCDISNPITVGCGGIRFLFLGVNSGPNYGRKHLNCCLEVDPRSAWGRPSRRCRITPRAFPFAFGAGNLKETALRSILLSFLVNWSLLHVATMRWTHCFYLEAKGSDIMLIWSWIKTSRMFHRVELKSIYTNFQFFFAIVLPLASTVWKNGPRTNLYLIMYWKKGKCKTNWYTGLESSHFN